MSLHKKAGQLLFGTFIAQSITFITLPIITRYVSPTEFGKYTQTLFLIATILPFATLRLESLTVSVSDEEVARKLAKMGLLSSSLLGIFFLPAFFLMDDWFSNGLGLGTLPILIITITLVSQSFAVILNQYNIRLKRYRKIMFGSVLQNSTTSIFQLFSVAVSPIYEFLAISFAAGRLSIVIVDTKKFLEILKTKLDLKMTRFLIQRFWKSSLILICGTFIETLIFSGINIFAGYKYGQEVAGYLGLALIIFAVPGTLIGSSFTSIIFSEYIPHEKTTLKVKKMLKTIILISVATTGGVFFLFPSIAKLFLSQNWSESIVLISKLGIPIGINILWISTASIMYKKEQFAKYLCFNTLRLVTSIITAAIFVARDNPWQSVVLAFFLSGAAILVFPIYTTYRSLLKN